MFGLVYTVELQWLEHLWNHKDMCETVVVRTNESVSQRTVGRNNMSITFSIFFNMNVCREFLLESPYGGDSKGYTQYTIFKCLNY